MFYLLLLDIINSNVLLVFVECFVIIIEQVVSARPFNEATAKAPERAQGELGSTDESEIQFFGKCLSS